MHPIITLEANESLYFKCKDFERVSVLPKSPVLEVQMSYFNYKKVKYFEEHSAYHSNVPL